MQMFNYILGLAIVGLACVSFSLAENIMDKPGHLFELRPRLGHMKEYPFIDIYKTYAAAFVLPVHSDRAHDDYRNYAPSGDECMLFLKSYRINEYELRDIDDFIVLDACLGYLYESESHNKDSETSSLLSENLASFIEDPKLSELYKNTKINDSLDDAQKECVGTLFLQSVQTKKQFSDVVCNNHWLEVFNTFAECQKSIPKELRAEDAYLSVIYELIRRRAKICFDNEVHALNFAIRYEYKNNPFNRASNSVKSFWSTLSQQVKHRKWPRVIEILLSAVQGNPSQINLREISNILRGVAQKNVNFTNRLLKNMSSFATDVINPKHKSKSQAADPDGHKRYAELVDNLCNFFRSSTRPDFYDYSTPIFRMLKMLEYEDVFGITRRYFLQSMLLESFETAPLYLAVSSCNLLTYTEAAFVHTPNNSKLTYAVVFKRDTSSMVQWPDAGFY